MRYPENDLPAHGGIFEGASLQNKSERMAVNAREPKKRPPARASATVELDDLQGKLGASVCDATQCLASIRQRVVDISSGVHSLSQQLYSPSLEIIGIAAAMRCFCRDFGVPESRHSLRSWQNQWRSSTGRFVVPAESIAGSAAQRRQAQSRAPFDVRLAWSTNELNLHVSDQGRGLISRVR